MKERRGEGKERKVGGKDENRKRKRRETMIKRKKMRIISVGKLTKVHLPERKKGIRKQKKNERKERKVTQKQEDKKKGREKGV